jgi:alpha-methylacyl-CoA racemase
MMLADHGAEVIRLGRTRAESWIGGDPATQFLNRSRKGLSVDLKTSEGRELSRRLCKSADGLIEGFRPGVMERLGLGPEILQQDNPVNRRAIRTTDRRPTLTRVGRLFEGSSALDFI